MFLEISLVFLYDFLIFFFCFNMCICNEGDVRCIFRGVYEYYCLYFYFVYS